MRGTLYTLTHYPTGHYWIGASMAWDKHMAGIPRRFERGLMPKVMMALSPDPMQWLVQVVRHVDGIDKHRLHRVRDRLVESLHRKGKPPLNPRPFAVARTTYHARVRAGMPAVLAATEPPKKGSRSKLVISDRNVRLTIAEAALALGCLADTLAKRLQKMRKRQPNLMSVSLDELAAGSKRARSFWK